jgi:hypothetical protein
LCCTSWLTTPATALMNQLLLLAASVQPPEA